MLNVGVIGYGYWGPNLVRNFVECPATQVVAVSDLSDERLARVRARYPGVRTTTDHRELLGDSNIHAIAIATPIATHYPIGLEVLRAGRHLWVEKPLTGTVAEAEELVAEARRLQRVLMVDHTFIYTPAVRKIKELIDSGRLGRLYYYDSVRVNLGLFQHDSNVLWDLAVHDLAIMEYLLGQRPVAVSATGIAHVPGQTENVAYLTCFFDDNLLAHINVNWLAPVKIRRTLIGGDKQMVCYDDLEPSEKVKVYDKGVMLNGDAEGIYKLQVGYRTGDMWAPKLDMYEALGAGVSHFAECIESARPPITDGQVGLQIVRLLEAATKSMLRRGELVQLTGGRVTA